MFKITHSVTAFTNPLERLRAGASAKVPIMLGNMENDASVFSLGMTNLTAFLEGEAPGVPISPDLVRSLYPGQNDRGDFGCPARLGVQMVSTKIYGLSPFQLFFTSPDELWSDAVTAAGVSSVFRYTYGDSPAHCINFSHIPFQVRCLQTCRYFPAQERGILLKVRPSFLEMFS
jgi:hypothetical protein